MRSAGLATAAGLAAAALLMVVAAFGGFTLDAGVVHLSVHNWRPLLAVLVLAMGALLWGDRLDSRRALEAVEGRVERHAIAVVVIVAAATAAIGLGQGTWAASGADASGYVSQARLLADGTLVDTEPLATRVMLPTGSWAFAPLGYRPGLMPGLLAPTYPIGLPLAMAPFVRLWGDSGAYVVVPLLGALAVLATFGVGTVVASRTAGLVASVLVATSPVFLFQLVQPMSDVAVTAWWSLAIALALARFPGAPIGAGLVSGLAIATRPNLLPMASVPVLVCVLGAHGRARRMASAAGFAVGVAPSVFMVFWLQARLFGSALTSGYGSAGDLYAFDNILPNVAAYAWRIVRGEAATLMLATVALVVLARWRGCGANGAPRMGRFRTGTWVAVAAFGLVVASYLPYYQFPEWSYLRFLLPAWPAVFAAVGLVVVRALQALPAWSRGSLLILVLVGACCWNVSVAAAEQVFALRRYDARYRIAGRYLDAALPPSAVIVTVQQSGSVRYYTRRPILRWDQLGPDLEAALAAVRQQGRHPVLLVEDWEASDIKQRFPGSAVARLDWPPRAAFGEEVRVHLFDPADRLAPRPWPADRVH